MRLNPLPIGARLVIGAAPALAVLALALLAPRPGLANNVHGVHAPFPTLGPVGDGRRAWLEYNCYGCHGNNAAGGMGPNIQHADGGDVSEAMNGDAKEGGMRSFKGIAARKAAKNITAYLKSIGTKNEPTWLDWWNNQPGQH